MRKTINKETIEGRIYDHSLEVKVTGPTSKAPGTEYIGGKLDVATDEDGVNIVTIYYTYVTEMTKSGTANKTYTALKQIIDGGRTILSDGFDVATKVRCDTALAVNDFYSDNAKTDKNPDGLVSQQRNEGGFVTIVSKLKDEKDRNTFECDVLMNGYTFVEADEEKNISEDYAIIKGCVFNFRNDMVPVTFTIKSAAGIKYFEDLDIKASNMVFSKVKGKIINQTIMEKKVEESAFDGPSVKEVPRNVKQWVIDWASPEQYDTDDAEKGITLAELKEIKAKRDTHLAEVKANKEAYEESKKASGNAITANASDNENFDW